MQPAKGGAGRHRAHRTAGGEFRALTFAASRPTS
ncbi:hypothetical protein X772_06080 [Mesorhizobium sp. LSJC280B00]|nr:hypothetical protein X772_06080 [Mesorhizobium sp. LSJC280B00]